MFAKQSTSMCKFPFSFAFVVIILCSTLLGFVENKSIFGIGTRIIGDQLLVKDVLQAPPTGWSYIPTIRFNYAIPEPITYIEIASEENVLAEVNFSYKNDLVAGTLTAINRTLATESTHTANTESSELPPRPFVVLIKIYGYNDTVLNLNAAFVLNRDQDFQGVLEPYGNDDDYEEDNEDDDADDDDDEELNSNEQNDFNTSPVTLNDRIPQLPPDEEESEEAEDLATVPVMDNEADNDAEFELMDKHIELGHRQNRDYKIYETFQTSLTTTQKPTNHSVVFYFIDSMSVTCIKFVIYDHFVGKSPTERSGPVVEYSHLTPGSFKAVVTDNKTTSLFVQMLVYGYRPEDVPLDYMPFMMGLRRTAARPTATPMERLRMLIKQNMGSVTMGTVPTTKTASASDAEDSNAFDFVEDNAGVAVEGDNDHDSDDGDGNDDDNGNDENDNSAEVGNENILQSSLTKVTDEDNSNNNGTPYTSGSTATARPKLILLGIYDNGCCGLWLLLTAFLLSFYYNLMAR